MVRKKNKKSFTLIEILVVATIIGLLLSGGLISYSQLTKQARDNRRKTDLEQIRSALEMYRSENSIYPNYPGSSCSGLQPILTPYIGKIPNDPKPNQYNYYCEISTNTYTISAYLETLRNPCSGNCGQTCTYSVGPYGQTCP
ncbi:MAG: type II secretion system protein [Microgenomates group bacterium]